MNKFILFLMLSSSDLVVSMKPEVANATHSEAHLSCNDIVVDIHHDTYGTMSAPQLTSLPTLPEEEPADIESQDKPAPVLNKKKLIASHSLVGLLVSAVATGIILAIKFTDCKS